MEIADWKIESGELIINYFPNGEIDNIKCQSIDINKLIHYENLQTVDNMYFDGKGYDPTSGSIRNMNESEIEHWIYENDNVDYKLIKEYLQKLS